MEYAAIGRLHQEGLFYYLLCEKTFVEGSHSDISSNTRHIKSMEALLVAMAEAQLKVDV